VGRGGYGPRFFTDIIPLAVLFLVPPTDHLLNTKNKLFKSSFILLALLSIIIHAGGAYSIKHDMWSHNPETERYPARLWYWWDNQILATYRERPLIIPFDSIPEGGTNLPDSSTTYGRSKRLDPTDFFDTVSYEIELAPGFWEVSFRARAPRKEGAPGVAGFLSVRDQKGGLLAQLSLCAGPPEDRSYRTQKAFFYKGAGKGKALSCIH
jgi:hypothetical protein